MDSKAILDLFYGKKEAGEKDSRNEKIFKIGQKIPHAFIVSL